MLRGRRHRPSNCARRNSLRRGGTAERLGPPASMQLNPCQSGTARRQTRLPCVAVGALSLVGLASLLLATAWGVGLSYDSVGYIAAARQFLHAADYPTWLYPATHWPPLLPRVLAAIGGAVRLDPATGARWLNACLFAANIALAATLVARHTGGFGWSALLASFLMLASQDMLLIHSMAWSEPLFIFLVQLAILLLAEHVDRGSPALLAASAGVTACAFLTRYLGGSLVAAGAIGLVVLGHRRLWHRIAAAAFFGTVGAVPTALWMLRSAQTSGRAADRVVASHPVTVADLLFGLQTASAWLIPKRTPDRAILFVVVAVGIGAAAAISSIRTRPKDERLGRAVRDFATLPTLLMIFILTYLGLLLLAMSFVDKALLDERTLSPVFVTALVFLLCAVSTLWRSGRLSRPLRAGLIFLAIYAAAFYAFHGTLFVLEANRDGLGIGNRELRQSEIIRRVNAFPPGLLVYSNHPEAIYILTGRPVAPIPAKGDSVAGHDNRKYSDQFSALRQDLQQGRAVVVLLDTLGHARSAMESDRVKEMRKEIPLSLIRKTEDGEIYRLQGVQIAGLQ